MPQNAVESNVPWKVNLRLPNPDGNRRTCDAKGVGKAFYVAGMVIVHLSGTLDSAAIGLCVAGAAESKRNLDVVAEKVLCRRSFLLVWVYFPLTSRMDPPGRPIFC